jgi:hypothetical protein
MTPASKRYTLDIDTLKNGKLGKATVTALDSKGNTLVSDQANLADLREREKLAKRMADKLEVDLSKFGNRLEKLWNETTDRFRHEEEKAKAEEGKPQAEPEAFEQRAERLLAEMPADVKEEAGSFLRAPDLVDRIVADIAALGVAGEDRLTSTLYLIGTSRLLPEPLAGLVKGPTASGKSYIIEKASRLFPPEAVLVATSLTAQSLYYMEPGSLQHRLIIAGERSLKPEDEVAEATRAIREMISAHRLVKLVTIKGENGPQTVLIEQEGPIAYLESTTRERIFDEDENRLLSIYTDERQSQTRTILTRLADDATGEGDHGDVRRIVDRHHAMQRLLKRRDIVIPFAVRLGELIPAERVEARRAFPHLLSMIQALTLLHQYQREEDTEGRIIATADDYVIARRLTMAPLTRLLGSGVPGAAKRFLERLRKWRKREPFTTTEARREEKHAKSAVWGWLTALSEAGLLKVIQEGRGRSPATWQLTDDQAEALVVLPPVNEVLHFPTEHKNAKGKT